MDDASIETLDRLYAKATRYKSVDVKLTAFQTEDLLKYLTAEERKFVESMTTLVQQGQMMPAVAPPPPAAEPVAAAPTPQVNGANGQAQTPIQINKDIDQDFWRLPGWGKELVQAKPEDDRDTMIMDLLNAIESMGEDKAKVLFLKAQQRDAAQPAKPSADQRMAAMADQALNNT